MHLLIVPCVLLPGVHRAPNCAPKDKIPMQLAAIALLTSKQFLRSIPWCTLCLMRSYSTQAPYHTSQHLVVVPNYVLNMIYNNIGALAWGICASYDVIKGLWMLPACSSCPRKSLISVQLLCALFVNCI